MATKIRVWEIRQERLVPVDELTFAESHGELELEEWIARSPDILGEDLLIISRQLATPAGRLDLLCIDTNGKLVIVELKRDLIPREAVAQALDYASWLDFMSEDEVRESARQYLKRDLEEAFEERFHTEPPDWVCQNHRVILVAARVDDSAERIIKYLAEKRGVEINAVFFNYAKLSDGKEVLFRSVLVPEEIAAARSHGGRRPGEEALMNMAAARQTLPMVEICRRMKNIWREERQNTGGGSFRYWTDKPDGGPKMVYGVNVSGKVADASLGELDIWVRADALAEVTGISEPTIRERLSQNSKPFSAGLMNFVIRLKSPSEAEQFVSELKALSGKS